MRAELTETKVSEYLPGAGTKTCKSRLLGYSDRGCLSSVIVSVLGSTTGPCGV